MVRRTRSDRAAAALLAGALVIALDIAVHRTREGADGLNVWGYRGPVGRRKLPNEIRVVVLGGSTAFGRDFPNSMPTYLQHDLNNPRLRGNAEYHGSGPITVINLASPYDRVESFAQTLHDFAWLQDEVACLYIGHADPVPSADAAKTGWRRQSAVFRQFGYLPILPSLGRHDSSQLVPERTPIDTYIGSLAGAVVDALARGRKVVVATHPFLASDRARTRLPYSCAIVLGTSRDSRTSICAARLTSRIRRSSRTAFTPPRWATRSLPIACLKPCLD